MSHAHMIGTAKLGSSKCKKRPKSSVGGSSPASIPDHTDSAPQTLRRKTSAVKKATSKKPTPIGLDIIGANSMGHHNSTNNNNNNSNNNLLGLDAANLYDSTMLPQLPAYEECLKNSVGVSLHGLGLEFDQYSTFPSFQEPSPPHSVTFSPPSKSRPSLPPMTSPTHMAAMKGATHQKHHLAAAAGAGIHYATADRSRFQLRW